MDGIYVKETLIYVKAKDFGPLPAVGSVLKLDGSIFKVTNASRLPAVAFLIFMALLKRPLFTT